MNKRWQLSPIILTLAAATCPAAAPPPADTLVTPDRQLNHRIDEAIKQGVGFLLAQKKSPEHWSNLTQTAELLYALLSVGKSVDDPRLRANSPELAPVVAWLREQPADTAIDLSFQALALCQVPHTPELKLDAERLRDALLKFVRSDGSVSSRAGANTLNTTETRWAYQALAALDDAGATVDPAIWTTANAWWRSNQQKDGGWPDIRVLPNSAPLATAAATAAMHLAAARMPAVLPAAPLTSNAGPTRQTQDAAAAKKLLADFAARTPDDYYLYLFESAASAAGLGPDAPSPAASGAADWYRTTAEEILKAQRQSGSWTGPDIAAFPGDAECYVSSFALLFLAKGRDPVIFTKLQYGGAGSHCNDRPDDDANLTQWLSRELDRPLHWQSLPIDAAPAELAASPILLITGSGDPNFSPEDIRRLRAFVQAGGLIVSTADAGDTAFTSAIAKKYAPQLAQGRYEMRPLPQLHVLFSGELYARISDPLVLLGLSNGVREWWVHSPVDLGASWQGRKLANREDFLLAANLLRYATGNGSLHNKLQTLPTAPSETIKTVRTLHLARLDYAGNPDPEPAAWPRLAAFAPARFHTTLDLATLKFSDLDPAKTPIAHMTGTTAFTLPPADLAALKKFLDNGGTLLADAAGASPRFTASFTQLMKDLYPDTPPAELPINDPVFNGSISDSVRLTDIEYRKYALLQMKERQVKPRILAVTLRSRHVILFSPEDITSGLLGTNTWGIRGYTPDCAANLARDLLLYANMIAAK